MSSTSVVPSFWWLACLSVLHPALSNAVFLLPKSAASPLHSRPLFASFTTVQQEKTDISANDDNSMQAWTSGQTWSGNHINTTTRRQTFQRHTMDTVLKLRGAGGAWSDALIRFILLSAFFVAVKFGFDAKTALVAFGFSHFIGPRLDLAQSSHIVCLLEWVRLVDPEMYQEYESNLDRPNGNFLDGTVKSQRLGFRMISRKTKFLIRLAYIHNLSQVEDIRGALADWLTRGTVRKTLRVLLQLTGVPSLRSHGTARAGTVQKRVVYTSIELSSFSE